MKKVLGLFALLALCGAMMVGAFIPSTGMLQESEVAQVEINPESFEGLLLIPEIEIAASGSNSCWCTTSSGTIGCNTSNCGCSFVGDCLLVCHCIGIGNCCA